MTNKKTQIPLDLKGSFNQKRVEAKSDTITKSKVKVVCSILPDIEKKKQNEKTKIYRGIVSRINHLL